MITMTKELQLQAKNQNHSCKLPDKKHSSREESQLHNPWRKTIAAGRNHICKEKSQLQIPWQKLQLQTQFLDKCPSCDRCWERRIYSLLLLLLRHMHIQLEAYKGLSFLVACRCADVQMCSKEGLFVSFCLPLKHWGRSWMPLPWCSLWISATAASTADLQNEWFSQAASSTSYSSSRLPSSSSACLPSSFTISKNWQKPTQQHRNKAQRQQTTLVSKVFEMLNKRIELLLRNPNLRWPFCDVLELQTLNLREPLRFKP